MISNKGFEKNCERLAKAIMQNPNEEIPTFHGRKMLDCDTYVWVSNPLVDEWNKHREDYIEGINKYLIGMQIERISIAYNGRFRLLFTFKK